MHPYLQTFFSRVTFFAQKVIVSRRQIIKKVILSLIELHPFLRLFCVANKGVKDLKRKILAQGGRSAVNKRPLTDGWQTYMFTYNQIIEPSVKVRITNE